jgi:hypothetical protein
MNKISGMVPNQSIGIVSSRPPTRGEQNPIKLPDMNDLKNIQAQREALRAEEAARANRPQGS